MKAAEAISRLVALTYIDPMAHDDNDDDADELARIIKPSSQQSVIVPMHSFLRSHIRRLGRHGLARWPRPCERFLMSAKGEA